MKTLRITVHRVMNSYSGSTGRLVYSPFARRRVENDCWQEFLRKTGQTARMDELYAMSSRRRTPIVRRIRASKTFREWAAANSYYEWTEPHFIAECDYDGRLSDSEVRAALFAAAVDKSPIVRIYPKANKTKPAHLWSVYITRARYSYL